MLRDYLLLQLTSPECGLQSCGVPMDLGEGQHCLIFAELRVLLSDGDGLRLGLQWMGQGCTKPCWRHLNVFRKGSDLVQGKPGYVEITCADPTKFEAWQEGDFLNAIDIILEARAKVDRGQLKKEKLETIEKAFGFRATADGLLASPSLRALVSFQSAVRYDWVHTFLCDGVLTSEAWRLVDAAESLGVASQADLCSFLKEKWVHPMARRHNLRCLWKIFDTWGARSNSSHRSIKCSASELLTLYSFLRRWADTRLQHPQLTKQVRIFRLVCKAVDLVMHAKRGFVQHADAGSALRSCLSEYLELHKQD